jgi:hypothetical protein
MRYLISQIVVVFAVVIAVKRLATQWMVAELDDRRAMTVRNMSWRSHRCAQASGLVRSGKRIGADTQFKERLSTRSVAVMRKTAAAFRRRVAQAIPRLSLNSRFRGSRDRVCPWAAAATGRLGTRVLSCQSRMVGRAYAMNEDDQFRSRPRGPGSAGSLCREEGLPRQAVDPAWPLWKVLVAAFNPRSPELPRLQRS